MDQWSSATGRRRRSRLFYLEERETAGSQVLAVFQARDRRILLGPDRVHPGLKALAKHRIVLVVAADEFGGDRALAHLHANHADTIGEQIRKARPAAGICVL